MEHSQPQFDNSPLNLKRIALVITFTFLFLTFLLVLSLMFFGGATTAHKKQKEKTSVSYELESLQQYEDKKLKDVDKAIEAVMRDYK
ncbi:MAG: hypothetical protein K0U66_03755 [Gammaproteobacteria bacterium]|nr:hypothetical protein [Gammaproteobacteria bacterium]